MRRPAPGATDDREGVRTWAPLATLILPTLLVPIDLGALFVALPHLSADLGASTTQELWIADIHGFLIAGFLVTMGTLGDRIGRRRLLLIGATAFAAASVMAAYATSPQMMIAARALLGAAGASLSPSILALISCMFRDPGRRRTAIAIWAMFQFSGGAIGPIVGGLLLERFWWGSVFLISVPLVAMLVASARMLPEHRTASAPSLELRSAALSLAAMLLVIYGVKELSINGATTPSVAVVAIVGGVVAGVAFVHRQRHLDEPLIDVRLLGDRSVRVALFAMFLAGGVLMGNKLMTTQYIQSVIGLAPADAGLWQAPTGLGLAAGSLLAPVIARRLRASTSIATGLALSVCGLALLTLAQASGPLSLVAVAMAVVAFGIGPLFVLGTGTVVGTVGSDRAGAAASLSETSNLFGSTLGMALLGSSGAAVYRYRMDAVMPEGLPAEPATVARETVAAAVAVTERLTGADAAALLDAARDAFTLGMNVVAGAGGVIMVGLLVMVRSMQNPVSTIGGSPAAHHANDSVTPAEDVIRTVEV